MTNLPSISNCSVILRRGILNSREAQNFLNLLLTILYLSERWSASCAPGSAPALFGAPLVDSILPLTALAAAEAGLIYF